MRKNYLLTPGPTPLPPEVCEALARPIIHHRTPQFQAVLKEVFESLKWVFQTKNDCYMLASSGTGAMETGRSKGQSSLLEIGISTTLRWQSGRPSTRRATKSM